jgi:hypothetical protein
LIGPLPNNNNNQALESTKINIVGISSFGLVIKVTSPKLKAKGYGIK